MPKMNLSPAQISLLSDVMASPFGNGALDGGAAPWRMRRGSRVMAPVMLYVVGGGVHRYATVAALYRAGMVSYDVTGPICRVVPTIAAYTAIAIAKGA